MSYLYCKKIDSDPINQKLARTNKPVTIINHKEYWPIWIEAIISKDPAALGQKNQLTGTKIIDMGFVEKYFHFYDL